MMLIEIQVRLSERGASVSIDSLHRFLIRVVETWTLTTKYRRSTLVQGSSTPSGHHLKRCGAFFANVIASARKFIA